MLFTRRLMLGLAMAGSMAGALAFPAMAEGPTEIDLFFPVPVDGKLARDMGTLIKEFNDGHPDIKATAVYTGSYDDTLIKTRASIKAGKPPAAVIMSANFLLDMQIENELTNLDSLIAADGTTKDKFLGQFFPALQGNAVIDRSVYGVPFHNSTPLLYINADQAKEAGLDPNKPPQTWAELTDWAKKLTKREGDKVTRWGIAIPCAYDYCGWMMETLTMTNGGRYYNEEFGGEVYYDTPSMLGALTWWNDLVNKHKVHRPAPAGSGRQHLLHLRQRRDDDAVDGLADLCARQRQVQLQGRFHPAQRPQRRADRRRLADHSGRRRSRQAEGRLDADQVDDLAREERLVEPRHRLFRAQHGRLQDA